MLDALSKVTKAVFLPWPPPRKPPVRLERFILVYVVPVAVLLGCASYTWPQVPGYAIGGSLALMFYFALKTYKWG